MRRRREGATNRNRRLSWAAGLGFAALVVAGLMAVRLEGRADHLPTAREAARSLAGDCTAAGEDYRAHQSGVWVTLAGRVVLLLPDEEGRFRHQRFLVRCETGQTLLIVNDVNIGTRVPVAVGEAVGVRGQFVWNGKGGLVHFTHHDPAGGAGGWILARDKVYG